MIRRLAAGDLITSRRDRANTSHVGPATLLVATGAKQDIREGFQRNLSNDGIVLGLLQDGLYLDRKMDFWIKRNARSARCPRPRSTRRCSATSSRAR
jgi:hypothetical protein